MKPDHYYSCFQPRVVSHLNKEKDTPPPAQAEGILHT